MDKTFQALKREIDQLNAEETALRAVIVAVERWQKIKRQPARLAVVKKAVTQHRKKTSPGALRPSEEQVLLRLPGTYAEVVKRTGLASSTVYWALKSLKDAQVIQKTATGKWQRR